MNVQNVLQLDELRRLTGIFQLYIDANNFLSGELPIYLFRYSAWALAEGGTAEVTASRTVDSMGVVLSRWPFQFLLQVAAKALSGIAELTEVDVSNRQFRFRRYAPNFVREPWSAVVMFSGQDKEMPLLEKCIMGLQMQPELTKGGQIVVCGPAKGAKATQGLANVEYLDYETESIAGRFLVGRKKNFAVSRMSHEKVLVCHTRIVLEQGCLSAMPEHFDVITPLVLITGHKGISMPYSDLLFQQFPFTTAYTRTPAPYIGYDRKNWQRYLNKYHPFIDGALFCIRKKLFQQIPLSVDVGWGEAEDVEWARRLLMSGKLLELCLDAQAISLVNKTNYYYRWGHLLAYNWLARLKGYGVSVLNQICH